MISLHYAEEVRAACELLYNLAAVQVENGQHPHAPIVLDWLEHVGAVAARLGGDLSRPAAQPLPPAGVMQ